MHRGKKRILKFPDPHGPKNIWAEFGLAKPEYEEERFAPAVDRDALQALVDKKLPPEAASELSRLALRFQSWADALAELNLKALQEELADP